MPGGDASVIRIKKTNKALSMKTDCNSKYCYLNPYAGGLISVCESARNVVCTGAVPLAITNCLNFGNPYNPEMYYQFSECIRGMGDACRTLGTPVTGGNVSFYNLSKDYAVFPTPTIGMLGLIEDTEKMMTAHFKNEGDFIIVLGKDLYEIGGSEYLSRIHNIIKGDAPSINPEKEKQLHELTLKLIHLGLINSAHDVSDGGLAVALAESCVMNRGKKIGCSVDPEFKTRKDFALFSESQSRILISVPESNLNACKEIIGNFDSEIIGKTGGNRLVIGDTINIGLDEIYDRYFNTIEKIMSE
jgi:phosphoribosylformylglycinamidine synthase